MVPEIIDYAASYFKYETPMLIRGELTHKALKKLQMKLQVNASSIEIDLGRRNYGYLALVLLDADYQLILNTLPFIPPAYLPLLIIPTNTTPIQVLELKEAYSE